MDKDLQTQVKDLELKVNQLLDLYNKNNNPSSEIYPKKAIFSSGIEGGDNGLVIGSSASKKIGFHGVTPVIQEAAITAPSGGMTIDSEARTAIVNIINALHNIGIIA